MVKFQVRDENLYIDDHKVIKGFESWNGWYWFATEEAYKQDSIIDDKVFEDDTIYFGFVQGHFDEWGYFSKSELKQLMDKGMVWEINKQDLPYSGRRSE